MNSDNLNSINDTNMKNRRPAIFLFVENIGDNFNELEALIDTAEYYIEDSFIIKDPTLTTEFFLSEKRLNNIKDDLELKEIKIEDITIIVGHKLSAKQHFSLEQIFETENLIDKIELILQIFTLHASSEEAKLQILLASTKYRSQFDKIRLLSKLGKERKGMVEYIGKGESLSQLLENQVTRTEKAIKLKLNKIKKGRIERRKWRLSNGVLSIGLAGYTCSGKSTILNKLTKSDTQTSSSLFTTVGTRSRSFKKDDLISIVTDTVGFVENLPHILISAFSSTMEEITINDVILLVIDGSDEITEINRKIETSLSVFEDLEVELNKVHLCINKIDLLTKSQIQFIKDDLEGFKLPIIKLSALEENFDEFYSLIDLLRPLNKYKISFPTLTSNNLEKFLYKNSIVIHREIKSVESTFIVITRSNNYFLNKLEKKFPNAKITLIS